MSLSRLARWSVLVIFLPVSPVLIRPCAEGLPKIEKLPKKFWAMLLERCPRLEELTIGGPAPSPRVFDIRHITAGRWLRLRSITIGDMVLISSTQSEEQARKDHAAFMAFFAAHPTLRSISLQHAGGSANFPSAFILPPNALPNLNSFGGPLKFVRTLPNPHRLRHLTLTCLHHSTSAFPPTLAVLQGLRNLVSLSIWIDLSFGQSYGLGTRTGGENGAKRGQQRFDDMLVMQSLLASSPGLKKLDLACFTRPAFGMVRADILHLLYIFTQYLLDSAERILQTPAGRAETRVIYVNESSQVE